MEKGQMNLTEYIRDSKGLITKSIYRKIMN